MLKVSTVVQYFIKQQKEYGYRETGNMVQHKWNMRDVIDQIDDDRELRKLIRFFTLMSDDKSFDAFFRQYDEYYDTMLKVIEERQKRKALIIETVKRASHES